MVTAPAFVWRGGAFRRALIVGGFVGVALGTLAWIDSGLLLAGILAFVITGIVYGLVMSRRMARYWPGAKQLSGDERVAVARATRRGERIGDPRLAQAVIDYNDGLHAAAEQGRPFRWLLPTVLVVALATAVFDGIFGTWGNLAASCIYLAALPVELFWWPKWRDRLLSNAERAAGIAAQMST